MPQTNLGNLFKLLSISFEPPTTEWVNVVVDGQLREEIKTAWEALELPQETVDAAYEEMGRYVGRDANEVMRELRREFTRLFLTDRPLITNSEGLWRKKKEGKKAVLIVNSYSIEVADFMRTCGVVKVQGYNDCIDFVETEFDFVAFLANGPEYLEGLGLDASELLDEFVDQHMKQWIPGFCTEVAQETRASYYRAVSALASGIIQEF